MSHMYGNEPPQGYYPEEEERYSQSELEEQDFQRYRDYVVSEKHNYDAPVNYVQDAPYEEHNNAAPVNFESPFDKERIWTCKFCDSGDTRGPYQDPFPHYRGFPDVCTDHMNLEFMDDVWVFSQEIEYLRVGEGHTWEAINNLRDRFDALEKILLN